MIEKLKNYFTVTNRRKILNKLQKTYSYCYRGIVLDIGGRDRGDFDKPKKRVDRWIFADIVSEHNPDIILDVTNMPEVETESIDVVNAIELFEHVAEPEAGLSECYRVLKPGGTILISTPLIYPIHADPYDFQRWTEAKWRHELEKRGFLMEKLEYVGGYFAVLGDIVRTMIKSWIWPLKLIGFCLFPILDVLRLFDGEILKNKKHLLSGYTTGYFIVAKK